MYNLLIVDDEYELRNGLCNYFPWDGVGFKVIGQMENGMQALDFIKYNPIDVVLCDIKMPVMSGIEFAKKIYESNLPIKIIFYSGFKEFDYAQKALEYGVKSYIVKSTRYSVLFDIFNKIKLELDREKLKTVNIEDSYSSSKYPANCEPSYYEKIIEIIKNYICQNYRNITLEMVSKEIHMNADYLSRFFKQRTGQNFSDYVLSVKMHKAAEMLSQVRYKTYEISEIVGYNNPKNFTRAFKNYFGNSPREYRNTSSK